MTLDALRAAAEAKRAADRGYRLAVLAALAEGWSFARVAEVAGVSRQAVHQLARRLERESGSR